MADSCQGTLGGWAPARTLGANFTNWRKHLFRGYPAHPAPLALGRRFGPGSPPGRVLRENVLWVGAVAPGAVAALRRPGHLNLRTAGGLLHLQHVALRLVVHDVLRSSGAGNFHGVVALGPERLQGDGVVAVNANCLHAPESHRRGDHEAVVVGLVARVGRIHSKVNPPSSKA
jgi:hypothetical protein